MACSFMQDRAIFLGYEVVSKWVNESMECFVPKSKNIICPPLKEDATPETVPTIPINILIDIYIYIYRYNLKTFPGCHPLE